MDRWRGRVALVTGASVGIGAAVSKHLASLGLNVIGCARNLDKLTELTQSLPPQTPGSFTPVQCDVRDEAAILSVFSLLRAKYGRLDITVNNAGLAKISSLTSGDTDSWRLMLDVNVLALSIVARESVKLMTESAISEGHIFNVGSMSGIRLPTDSSTHFYSATKFAVRSLTEGLRRELRAAKKPIKVTLISPGIVEAEIGISIGSSSSSSSMNALQGGDIAQIIEGALALPAHVDINDIQVRPIEQDN